MASTDNEIPTPIIVKKIKKGGGGHHGGAWKVAYADFVTAMMAFFLLMWLLNVTTEEQKNAISNYFDPTHPRVSSDLSGSGGVLGGMTMSPDGAMVSNVQSLSPPSDPTVPKSGTGDNDKREQAGNSEFNVDAETKLTDTNTLQNGINVLEEIQNMDEAELEQLQAFVEAEQNMDFEAIKQKILEEVSKSPELNDLLDHLMVDITPEGLRIQIIDKEGRSMFPIGSAGMFDFMQKLVAKVTQVIIPQPNLISVRGHTDGKKYPDGATYNNWNLSADRALASRKAMLDGGLTADRIENVIGKADREHLLPDEPLSARNRRISIVLLREKLENAEEIRKAAAEAIRKNKETSKNAKQQPTMEDRENIPELDQKINKSSNLLINDNKNTDLTTDVDTGNMVGNEIQRLRGRNEAKILRPTELKTFDESVVNEPQILQFP